MDSFSKQLLTLKLNGPSSALEISNVIINWKNTFSLYWYQHYINDDQKKLDFVFSLLFELTEFPDSNVTISTFNAIGALLVSLAPFRAQELIISFKKTLSSLEVSPNTSCAIISTFVFLSHHVTDSSISKFIESTPILPHFGADLKSFIHHIPTLIEQMNRLNMEFHQALLRSLITSFGRNPVSSFIEAVMLIVSRFPNKLLLDLMEFIQSNKLDDTLLSVGGPILNDPTFSKILTIEQKNQFLIVLKKKLFIEESETKTEKQFDFETLKLQTEITATELEQSVSIIWGLKKQEEIELKTVASQISDFIWDNKTQFKSVFQRILYPLAKTIEELRPTPEDSSNQMSRKIMALGYHEDFDESEILSICEPFIESRDECFISVLTFFARSLKEKCHAQMEKLFEKDDYSWVQRVAILNLIDNLDQFQMENYIVDYNQKCIDFLINCALSLQTELSSFSREVISRFVSLNNVETFRDSILKCDFFNFQITKNILMLLNVLVNSISPSPLRCFIGIVLELFDFTLSDMKNSDYDDSGNSDGVNNNSINIYPPFVSDCFEFLSHYPGLFHYSKSIERICICKMQEIYFSFTQDKLFFQLNDNLNPNVSSTSSTPANTSDYNQNASISSSSAQPMYANKRKNTAVSKILKNNIRPILSTITTDVVADASLVNYEFLKPLKNCLKYLTTNHSQSAGYRSSALLKLLPIFPKEILPYYYDEEKVMISCKSESRKPFLNPEEIELVSPEITRIFYSNRDQIVISSCCEIFYQSLLADKEMVNQVKEIIDNTEIKSSLSAFVFFKLIFDIEPDASIIYLKKLLNISEVKNKIFLPPLISNELALRAGNIPAVYEWISGMEEFSFLQFKVNRFNAKRWFEQNEYCNWPLIDSDLSNEIKKMFMQSYSINVNDCKLLDNEHWKFLMENKSMFFKDAIQNYLDSNKYRLKTICTFSSSRNDERMHFNKSENDAKNGLDNLAKILPTTALLIKRGKFIKNEILVKNFLKFSKLIASDELLSEMEKEFPNLSTNIKSYTKRNEEQLKLRGNLPAKAINQDHNELQPNVELKKEEDNNEEYKEQKIEEEEYDDEDQEGEINKIPAEKSNAKESSENPKASFYKKYENPIAVDCEPGFPMKSKFLKRLCKYSTENSVVVSMYRMHLINRIDEITTPKQFLYYLRFLRINMIISNDTREVLATKKNTIENFPPIIRKLLELANSNDLNYFQPDKDLTLTLLEFVKLASKLFTLQELAKLFKTVSVPNKTESAEILFISNLVLHSAKFANLANSVFSVSNNLLATFSMYQLKSSNLTRIPSILLFIIQGLSLIPDEESSQFFASHSKHLFNHEIVADFAVEFLLLYLQKAKNDSTKKIEEFFDPNALVQIALLLFDSKKSIFKEAGQKSLFEILFSLMKSQSQLAQFQPLIEKLPVCGYSLPFIIDLVTSYFANVAYNVYHVAVTPMQKEQENIEKKRLSQSVKKSKQKAADEMRAQNAFNFQKDFGIKELRIVQSIYQAFPSIQNSIKLGKLLLISASFFDPMALIFGKFVPFEDGAFLGVFCMVSMFSLQTDKKKRFAELVETFEKENKTFKSRSEALKCLADNDPNFDLGFALASLETNNDNAIKEVINLFK